MTREELDAIRERLAAAKAWRPFTGSWDDIAFGQRATQDVEALLVEVERLRDALSVVAAPLSPAAPDLWAGVETARKVLKEGDTEQVAAARRAAKNLGDGRRA
jgi:hypothetical protein